MEDQSIQLNKFLLFASIPNRNPNEEMSLTSFPRVTLLGFFELIVNLFQKSQSTQSVTWTAHQKPAWTLMRIVTNSDSLKVSDTYIGELSWSRFNHLKMTSHRSTTTLHFPKRWSFISLFTPSFMFITTIYTIRQKVN